MEKYGVNEKELIGYLRDEEAQLMAELGGLMSKHEKTASELARQNSIEQRLKHVRDKIMESDLAGK